MILPTSISLLVVVFGVVVWLVLDTARDWLAQTDNDPFVEGKDDY